MKRIINFRTTAWCLGLVFWFIAAAAWLSKPESPPPDPEPTAPPAAADVEILEAYDGIIALAMEEAQTALGSPVFTIQEEAQAGPEPNPACYGQAQDPTSLQWLLDDAAEILEGQDTYFSTALPTYVNSKVDYYLDKSIFAVTWMQVIDNFVYTFSEIKIAHPSQFRRFLPEDTFDSKPLLTTTTMSEMTNAVVATSGDFYRCRKHGICTFKGQVCRFVAPEIVDTCFVDINGDLIMKPAGTFATQEAVQQFVDDNQISFSLAFGPILVENGVRCEPEYYALGEVNDTYPRAALCQMGDLHYLIITANGHGIYWNYPTIHDFAARVAETGCEKAYALDGGQTAAIVMNDRLINPVQFGTQRIISDMLYFATALPQLE